jgi:hypothetical protein
MHISGVPEGPLLWRARSMLGPLDELERCIERMETYYSITYAAPFSSYIASPTSGTRMGVSFTTH